MEKTIVLRINNDGITGNILCDGVPKLQAQFHPANRNEVDVINECKSLVETLITKTSVASYLACMSNGASCGCVGVETTLKDAFGKHLYVGDVVRILEDNHDMGLAYVISDGFQYYIRRESCNFKPDRSNRICIIKEKSYIEVKKGEIYKFVVAL